MLILAKAPVPGRVKTRLCPPCTHDQAAAIAEAALVDTVDTVMATPSLQPRLVLDGRPGTWLPAGLPVTPQVDGDLGARIGAAFESVDGPAVLIGMDTPQMTSADLREVVASLAIPAVDAVIGLTPDGGWWTIGFRRPSAAAFVGVPMSQPTTGSRQLARLHHLGLTTRVVGSLIDIDTFADAQTVARRTPGTHLAAAVRGVAAELGDAADRPRPVAA